MKKTFLGIFSITVITYLLSGCTTSNNGNITKLSEDKINDLSGDTSKVVKITMIVELS